MRNSNTLLKIGVHVALWLFLFLLNYLFLKNYSVRYDHFMHISTWLVYALVFYTTYYFIMQFFFKKNWVVFIGISLLVLILAFNVRDYSGKRYRDYMISKNISLRERAPFLGERPPHFMRDRRGGFFAQRGEIINNSYGLLIFYLLAFSLRLIQKGQDDEKQKMKLEKEKVSTELSFLKQQINPHFLFNSLNSIYSLSISKSDATPDSILKLSSILRYVLYDSEKPLVYLKDELKTTQDYIDLQHLRLTEKVSVLYKVEGATENYKIEPLLLIPIIENAFKYGVDNVKESFIDIQIKIEDKKLELKVSNKIVGNEKNKREDSGIGIKNIKRRLELLHEDSYEFDINEKDEVFSVRLLVNLKA